MKVSLNWIRDFVDIDMDVGDLANRLTMAGLEVEGIESFGVEFRNVIVARIEEAKPHPSADKLKLCTVNTGKEFLPIVCGASNVRKGVYVALAKVGATLPGGYTIKSVRIRGEISEGMLCSEAELGISEDHSGVMILPENLPLGMNLVSALNLEDVVFEVAVTPNRGDCLSILGIAREIAAITGKSVRYPSFTVQEDEEDIHDITSVTIEDPDLCPRYTARIIRNITVGPSPLWMRRRLQAVGLRAINNAVDVTNYVMMELGQPLHAFDFRFLEEGRIVVRQAQEGERFYSLDGKERILRRGVLMICDGVKPVAIAGIMGGLNSEVKDDTTTILLESAYFSPASIRRSSRWLGMNTDASFRFERGIDPEGVIKALNRAASLIAALGGGVVCRGVIDNYPKKIVTGVPIYLRWERLNSVLGTRISREEIERILVGLEMKVSHGGDDKIVVIPPSFRMDVCREIDLIEEVARIYGYEKVPVTLPPTRNEPGGISDKEQLEREIRAILRGCGFSEIITYSFVPDNFATYLNLSGGPLVEKTLRIKNPLSEEQSVMRTTMAYSLMETVVRNVRQGQNDLKFFEFGKIYLSREGETLPEEQWTLGLVGTGYRYGESWYYSNLFFDFYDLKGIVEKILEGLHIGRVDFESSKDIGYLHPGRACFVRLGETILGCIGEVHPEVQMKFDIQNRVIVAELNLEALLSLWKDRRIFYRELSKFPVSVRDAAFLVDKDVEAKKLIEVARSQGEEVLENVMIFDVYESEKIGKDKKSIGLRFVFRSKDRTLTDSEVNAVYYKLIRAIEEAVPAKLRSV
ncbi:MAG: phenylalanine--tRNA ligase subunit beta [Syntrophales bacterium]|nr:phenylalanine--tRNA ligase subunit beta [Syntrophales bacterium]